MAEPELIAEATVPGDSTNEATESEPPSPFIGKLMLMYGPLAETEQSKRIVSGHRRHAEIHGHSFQLFDREVLDGMWSKQAWLLSVMLEQMRKPEALRTRWLHWADADIVLMNPNVPLDIFLPPEADFDHINLLVSNDHNGLNAGSFFIRVNDWGVRFLIDVLALRTYRPHEKLKYVEQSAMTLSLHHEKYKNATVYVPQRWFNAYRGPRQGARLVQGRRVPPNTIRPGDLQLHFSGGKKNKAHIDEWLDYAADESAGWNLPLDHTRLHIETALFWKLQKEKLEWDTPILSPSRTKPSPAPIVRPGRSSTPETSDAEEGVGSADVAGEGDGRDHITGAKAAGAEEAGKVVSMNATRVGDDRARGFE